MEPQMSKFTPQIGDLVECISDFLINYKGPKKGERFIVTSVEDSYLGFKLRRLSSELFFETEIEGIEPCWHKSYFILIHRSKAAEVLYGK